MGRSPRSWAVPGLVVAWTCIHAWLLLQSGAWSPPGAPWWAFGSPNPGRLVAWGGLIPARVPLGEWPRLVLHAFLHQSLLGLLLDGWIALWAGRTLARAVGSARTWLVFLLATVAGSLAEVLLARGLDAGRLHVGAWFGILGWMGGLGVYAFTRSEPLAHRLRRSTVFFLLIAGGLWWWLGGPIWGLLGGLAGGVVATVGLGTQGLSAPPGPATRVAAMVAVGVLVAAVVEQHATPDRLDRATLAPFLEEVATTERLADRLYERPDRARPEERMELTGRLDRLADSAVIRGMPGHDALLAYVEALRPIASGQIPDPIAFEQRRDAARREWRKAERRLRAASGASRSFGGYATPPPDCR